MSSVFPSGVGKIADARGWDFPERGRSNPLDRLAGPPPIDPKHPLVAETFDFLNDANGEHVKPAHAWAALDSARTGRVVEGAVGFVTGSWLLS